MRKVFFVLALASLGTFGTGCAGVAFMGASPANGFIYAGSTLNKQTVENAVGAKTGEACAESVFGWVTWGDASVQAAAKNGGITKVGAVDSKINNYLGIYAKYCAVVTGE